MGATQWARKRVAMLRDSGTLDRVPAKNIRSRARKINVDVAISNNKIVFPEDKGSAKKILQLLNEEIFLELSLISLYETNSKRQIE